MPDAASAKSASAWPSAPIGHVVRLVLRGAFGLILLGLCIGLPLTFAVGALGNQLYGMNPFSPPGDPGSRPGARASALAASASRPFERV
jgi:hypothetical protein